MNLIIVESPTKARTLSRFLGKDFVIDPTLGHVLDLPKSKIGVDPENNFAVEYSPVAKKKDVVAKIKEDAKSADKIYLATDPDREGEAISAHVKNVLSENHEKVAHKFSRIVFHEITEGAVKEAIANPRDIDLKLVDAQTARRVLDRLVGYKLSPLLWRKVRVGLSAGRVQSVAVRLIVDREREIKAFVPLEYWEVFAALRTQGTIRRKQEEFAVKLVKINDTKADVKNKEQADQVVANLEKAIYEVANVEKKEVSKSPYPPFTTSTVSQAASRNYFWTARKTMSVAQKLYEEGLITYHRTDSLSLNVQAVFSARGFIKNKYPQNYLPEKSRFYKTTSKVAQEAHEAIRPTNVRVLSDKEEVVSLGKDAQVLYGLIWRRFVACQMANSIYDKTTIDVVARGAGGVENASYTLRATGQIMKFDGWRALYSKAKSEEGEAVIQLPEVWQGEVLQLVKVDAQQKFTEPLARFTEASLVKTLEKLGIGRPSTYAPTITTVQDRQYVEKSEGKFQPTLLGEAVNDFLVANFPDIVDYSFTAGMEDDLDNIARGEKKWVPVLKSFWQPFSKKLEGVQKTAERIRVRTESTGEKCPKCREGGQVIRVGRFGKFLSCSRFPDCDWKDTYIEKVDVKCPECGQGLPAGEVIVRKTRRGKRFYGCSRYPNCKWASWRRPDTQKVNKPIA